jgi:hypothetical protein
VYDVFFQKDTGHPYDWESAAVKFVQNSDGQYIRDGLWLEQDGNRPYTSWTDIPSTFYGYICLPQELRKPPKLSFQ